jgi:hypothetical protein
VTKQNWTWVALAAICISALCIIAIVDRAHAVELESPEVYIGKGTGGATVHLADPLLIISKDTRSGVIEVCYIDAMMVEVNIVGRFIVVHPIDRKTYGKDILIPMSRIKLIVHGDSAIYKTPKW